MSADDRSLPPLPPSWRSIDAGIVACLIALSIASFLRRGPTAFEWPAIDMAACYERAADPAFLQHDYFTNSASEPNPRHVFGNLVIGLTRLLQTDWYSIYFGFKVGLVIAFPALWYLALLAAVRDRLTDDRRRVLARGLAAAAVVLVMNRKIAAWTSIAWWSPYPLFVASHTVALLIGLLALVMDSRLTGPRRFATLPPWIAATAIHPAVGLIVWLFAGLTTVRRADWLAHALRGLLGVFAPALLVARWYQTSPPLSAAEFIEVYVRIHHPFHYDVAQLASHTKSPWWVSFLLLIAGMACCGVIAWRRGQMHIAAAAACSLLAYAGCVVLQYLGTDIFPSKSIAQLGPTRFSSVGYYLLAILVMSIAIELRPPGERLPVLLQRLFAVVQRLCSPARTGLAALLAAVLLFAGSRDDLSVVRGRTAPFYDWVDARTSPDAVFHLPFTHKLHQDLPVLGRRAVLASEAFPFREDAFHEHARRLELGYGSLAQLRNLPGRTIIDRRDSFFRRLKPADFVRIADEVRLDYVIVEQSQRSALAGWTPCFEDDHVAVFDLASLREPPNSR